MRRIDMPSETAFSDAIAAMREVLQNAIESGDLTFPESILAIEVLKAEGMAIVMGASEYATPDEVVQ
jgi:hypothetical protein